jgi:hypothetical protein
MNRISKKISKSEKKQVFKTNSDKSIIIYNSINTKPINTINCVFEILRNQIPTFPYERRLSKIDTLNITISYINLLKSIIESNLNLYDYLLMVLNNNYSTKVNWANSGSCFI